MFSYLRNIRACGYFGGAKGCILARRYDDALKKIKKAIKLSPEAEPDLLYLSCLGECYMRLERYEDAVEVLSDTLKKMEVDPETWGGNVLLEAFSHTAKCLEYSESKLSQQTRET